MRCMGYLNRKMFLLFLSLASFACQEKKSQPTVATRTQSTPSPVLPEELDPNAITNSNTENVESNTGTSDTLCADLRSSTEVKAEASIHIDFLCGSSSQNLAKLRSSEYLYKGGASSKILVNSSEIAGKKTKMDLYTANVYDTDAKTYMKLVKLQQTKPKDFKAAADSGKYGFKYDADIDYEVIDTSASMTNFSYLNDKESTVSLSYKGQTKYIDMKSSQSGTNRYAVVTKLTNPSESETLKSLLALVVINEYDGKDSAGKVRKYAEVFTLSNQTYDNNGDHNSTVNKAKQNLGAEQIRGAENAAKAAAYFKVTGT